MMIDELIALNQSRLEGYSRVVSHINEDNDEDLLALLEKRMQQAQQFNAQLIPFGTKKQHEHSNLSASHDAKWSVPVKQSGVTLERSELLNICIHAEIQNVKTYQSVLTQSSIEEESLTRMIEGQCEQLEQTVLSLENRKK